MSDPITRLNAALEGLTPEVLTAVRDHFYSDERDI